MAYGKKETDGIGRIPKPVRRILRAVAVVLLSCTVLLAAAAVLPRLFGIVPYAVRTGSMEPAIPVGALVYVDADGIVSETNDIAAFRLANGTVVIHRVIDVKDGKYITQGDQNPSEDLAPVSPSQVLGTYAFHIPLIGYLFLLPAVRYTWLALTLGSVLYLMFLR